MNERTSKGSDKLIKYYFSFLFTKKRKKNLNLTYTNILKDTGKPIYPARLMGKSMKMVKGGRSPPETASVCWISA